MNHSYSDITSKLGDPLWWDEAAVPRYCEFGPRETANIYADHRVLLEIACQSCGARFKVCMSGRTGYPAFTRSDGSEHPRSWGLDELVLEDEIHYGDPPNNNCCMAGPTMNSVPLRVLEFWDSHDENGAYLSDGRRRPELEREIKCDWAEDHA